MLVISASALSRAQVSSLVAPQGFKTLRALAATETLARIHALSVDMDV